jgi:acyl-CoA thioesterase FadM
MGEFMNLGLGWVIRTAHMDFKRPLGLGDRFRVRTWVDAIHKSDVTVQFEIEKLPAGKAVCAGWFAYTMVKLATGRAEPIPDEIAAKYAV